MQALLNSDGLCAILENVSFKGRGCVLSCHIQADSMVIAHGTASYLSWEEKCCAILAQLNC